MSRDYMRQWLDDELRKLFITDDHAAVVNWMLSHRGVPKVVLIGSGFSRNAVVKSGLGGSVAERTPLWPQVTEALRHGLGYTNANEGPLDALQVAEQYQESVGATEFRSLLLRLLKDDEIEPGEAHNALQTFPAEAIITTNQLDTLLDRMEGKWHPVIECSDLPLARPSRAWRREVVQLRSSTFMATEASRTPGCFLALSTKTSKSRVLPS